MEKYLAQVRTRLENAGGLQWRIQLLMVVGLLAIFTFFWLAGRQAVEKNSQQALNQQLTTASLIASWLDQRVNTALTVLETASAQPGLSSDQPATSQASLFRETQLQLSTFGQRLFWLDPNGAILWTEPLDPGLLSKPFPNFSAVHPALAGNESHISELYQSLDSSQTDIVLAVPVFKPTGEIDSLLVEEIRTNQLGLAEILDQVDLDDTAYIEVVNHQGKVIASSLSGHDLKKGDHTDEFARLIDSQQPLVGECHQCHLDNGQEGPHRVDEVLAFVPLSTVAWGVAVRQSASQVMAPIDQLRRQILLGGGVALVAALLVTTWFLRRQVVGPIQALHQASVQWATGNLGVPTPYGGIDEVARLTANLEHMRERLDATLEDHRRWNEALEEMVEERTREMTVLYEQVQSKEVMCKRLLGKVLTTQEEERARLARELHDAIGQSLTAIIMTSNAVESILPDTFVTGKEKLAHLRSIATHALQDLRNLIFDLRPEILDDLGLALALRSQVKKYLEPAGVQVRLRAAGLKDQLPAEVERAVFRVVQEAITNIARHAQASEANISLTKKDNHLVVRIEDNGVGFDPHHVMNGQRQAWGIHGMQERITLLGGKFYIGAKPNSGTLVLAEIPLDQN